MIDTIYSAFQIGAAGVVAASLFPLKANSALKFSVISLIAYWFTGSLAQEAFNTFTPSAITFFLALGVTLFNAYIGFKYKLKWPLIVSLLFVVTMMADATHYFTVWTSSLPAWNMTYQHLSVVPYYLSLVIVQFTAIKTYLEMAHERHGIKAT